MYQKKSQFSVADNANWTRVQKTKKTHQRSSISNVHSSNLRAPTKRVSAASETRRVETTIKVTECFKGIDERLCMDRIYREQCITKILLVDPIDESERLAAIKDVCDKTGWEPNDWYAMSEAENLVIDQRLVTAGYRPVFSEIMCGAVTINDLRKAITKEKKTDTERDFKTRVNETMNETLNETMNETLNETMNETLNETMNEEMEEIKNIGNGSDFFLPMPIALVCGWFDPIEKKWMSKTVSIMKTISDMWNCLNGLSIESRFSMPLKGKQDEAEKIFKNIMSCATKENQHSTFKGNNKDKEMRKMISSYNSLHPTWSFVKVGAEVTIMDTITVPFIRSDNDRSKNDININLKDTISNQQLGLHALGNNFATGYIPLLVLNFIGGGDDIPDEIVSVVFSKTIATSGNMYYRGYRVRVLTKDDTKECLGKCEHFIKEKFVNDISELDRHDYKDCVVTITVPK